MTGGSPGGAESNVRVSVIVSTYNQPEWLEKVLWGYAVQSRRDFQLLIADDGSGPDTAAVLERVRAEAGLRMKHVWHEDRGFRKCEILNRAIQASDGDYLIFSDGDCIPRADFVEVHASLAEPARFLSGGVVRLSMELSRRLTPEDVRQGRFSDAGWLRANGWRAGRHALRLVRSRRVAALLDALTPTGATWNGGNASTWREAVFAVNGYDHTMRYGGEDRALGERLENLGLRGKQVRHRTVCVHLDHSRPYRDLAAIRENEAIRARIRKQRETRAPEGLRELSWQG